MVSVDEGRTRKKQKLKTPPIGEANSEEQLPDPEPCPARGRYWTTSVSVVLCVKVPEVAVTVTV
jgi:hypothetical protein